MRCAAFVLVLACAGSSGGEDALPQWPAAERAWRDGDIDAYRMWSSLDRASEPGRAAHARLARAARHYHRGVALLEAGEEGAKDALAAGVAIAPMDPRLYLRLARACRAQDLDLRAAEYYSKYLAVFPDAPESEAARAELRRLDPQLAEMLVPVAAVDDAPAANVWLPFVVGLLAGVALSASAQAGTRWARGRGISLAKLVESSPEFHPAVAYLVGSLRHELLKHRIGAAADALTGTANEERLSFLHGRLFGGQPLQEAWEGHVLAFEQALGHRVDLRRDRWFRAAGKAVRDIARLEEELRQGRPRSLLKLRRAHAELMELDQRLADLVSGLVRTPVDGALLHEIVDEVRAEHSAGRVDMDPIEVVPSTDPVVLEVFRVDLVLILKNVVRNAVLAVDRSPPPRRVRVRVGIDLEPTGEETVAIRVEDTSRESLDPAILFDRRVDRGLGLVAAAVQRYGGSIDVERGADGFEKAVVISFFRAFDDVADGAQESRDRSGTAPATAAH